MAAPGHVKPRESSRGDLGRHFNFNIQRDIPRGVGMSRDASCCRLGSCKPFLSSTALSSIARRSSTVQYMRRQQELRRKREAIPPEVDEDEIEEPELPRARKQPMRECRVCRHRLTAVKVRCRCFLEGSI